MEPLYGSFEHSFDSKGRFVIPAPLRSRFERNKDAAVVSCYLERCLAVWPPDEFSQLLSIAQQVQGIGPQERHMARALTGYSAKVDIDTQWRITVPSFWREYAGLEPERPLMVVGVLDRIELWSVELWRQHMAPTMEGLAKGTSRFFPPIGPGGFLSTQPGALPTQVPTSVAPTFPEAPATSSPLGPSAQSRSTATERPGGTS